MQAFDTTFKGLEENNFVTNEEIMSLYKIKEKVSIVSKQKVDSRL